MHSILILIWEIVLIGFNSVWRISSHWKKIFSAAWETVGEYSILLVTWNWGYAYQNKPNVTCKHGKEILSNLCQPTYYEAASMRQQPLPILSCCSKFYVSTSSSVTSVPSSRIFLWPYVFPVRAGLGSVLLEPAQSSYLSCSWSALNKKFVFVSMNKITPCLIDLLHQDPLNGSEKHRGTPLFRSRLLYNVHVLRTQHLQLCADASPC